MYYTNTPHSITVPIILSLYVLHKNYKVRTTVRGTSTSDELHGKSGQKHYMSNTPNQVSPPPLQHPLGQWTPQAALAQTWLNTYHPITHQIIAQDTQGSTTRHVLQHQTQTHVYYSKSSGPTELPPTNYPITCETQQTGFWITLPVYPILSTTQPSTNPHQGTILQQIQLSLPKYAPELWTKSTKHPTKNYCTFKSIWSKPKAHW